ncbi:hypothetical protein [Streptomyces sp. RM72]
MNFHLPERRALYMTENATPQPAPRVWSRCLTEATAADRTG